MQNMSDCLIIDCCPSNDYAFDSVADATPWSNPIPWNAMLDDQGRPILDENGNYILVNL
jgi:hypothetical protein